MSFVDELKRRNVFRVAVLYVIASWVILQVVDVLSSLLPVPHWTGSLVFVLLVAGLLPALIFSWVYELTPDGLKREREVDRSLSVTHETGRKVNILIAVLLVLAIAVVVLDRIVPESAETEVTKSDTAGEARSASDSAEPTTEQPRSAPDRSVAVLPFANRSAREEDVYFVDGIHDDIITKLARIDSLTVISRTSVEQFRNASQSMREIGALLGVKTILEGGVQRSGNRIRINVQLVNVEADAHVWAQTYDRELTTDNLFAIQSEISTAVATALNATLSPAEKAQIETAPTGNMAALNAYFLGRRAIAERTSASLVEAERHLKDAIALDPDYALAYVALADTYWLQTEYRGLANGVYQTLARPLIEKALVINDRLGEAYISLASLEDLSPADKEALYRKGIELAPGYVPGHHWYGVFLMDNGRPVEALVELEEAARLDPLSAIVRTQTGNANQMLGRFSEARVDYEAALRIDDRFAPAHNRLGVLALFTGQLDEAVIRMRQALALDPGSPETRLFLTMIWDLLGGRAEADRSLAALADVDSFEWYSAYASAFVYANRGDLTAARGPAQTVLELVPDVQPMLFILGLSDFDSGRADEAVARYERAIPALADQREPAVDPNNVQEAIDLAYFLLKTDATARADRLLERALRVTETMPRLGLFGYWLGDVKIYALRGQRERALIALRQAADDGWPVIVGYNAHLEPLKSDPEYQGIAAEMESKLAAQLERVQEMEARGELAPLPD